MRSIKRVMVDMSATLIHHGHIRLLEQASQHGSVIVGLTSDDEILRRKHYQPELSFAHRKEILTAIRYVDDVVMVPWVITQDILEQHQIDLLIHGEDNVNPIDSASIKVVPRTRGISSTQLRCRAQKSITQINNQKLMLTPGPAALVHESIKHLKPLFGRGDDEYSGMARAVISWIKDLSGQDEVVMAQGSATFALELAAHTFVKGQVLLISTGYYSDRLRKLLPAECKVKICQYDEIVDIQAEFDWILCAYTETSTAFRIDLSEVKNLAERSHARLYVDATGSIGLEKNHELADVMAFSSCKGLFGMTGACFIAYKNHMKPKQAEHFYFNVETHRNKLVTGPYHAIASLYGIIKYHHIFRQRVADSKACVLERWPDLVRKNNQPLLCTYIARKIIAKDKHTVLYSPRSDLNGSVICHLGEIHQPTVNCHHRISLAGSS